MFTVVITEKGGEQKRMDFDKPEVTIGRVQGNDIILPKGNVSKRHSRIVLKDGKFIIVDLKSTNGTYVNGRKITSPLVIKGTDKIYIGDFILAVEDGEAGAGLSAPLVSGSMTAVGGGGPSAGVTAGDSAPGLGPGAARRPGAGPPPPPARSKLGRETAQAPAPLDDDLNGLGGDDDDDAPSTSEMSPRDVAAARAARPGGPSSQSIPARPMAQRPAPGLAPRDVAPRDVAPRPRPAPAPAAVTAPQPRRVAPAAALRSTIDPARERTLDARREALDRVATAIDLRGVVVGDGTGGARVDAAIKDVLDRMQLEGLLGDVDRGQVARDTAREAAGLGVLEELLSDGDAHTIYVNRPDHILVERGGRVERFDGAFSGERAALLALERLAARSGRPLDGGEVIDLRLPDGAALTAVVGAGAVRGPSLVVRRPTTRAASLDELARRGALGPSIVEMLEVCLAARRNVIVTGVPGSGKTELLSALVAALPEGERIVSVEAGAGLVVPHDNWVALAQSGRAPAEVVRHAFAMGGDRLVVDGCAGGEAFEVLAALAGGPCGALWAVAGESPRHCVARISALARAASGAPPEAVAELIGQGVDVIVHLARTADGGRRVARVVEVIGGGEDGVQLEEIFLFRGDGGDDHGRGRGQFVSTGFVPRFYEEIVAGGGKPNTSIFRG